MPSENNGISKWHMANILPKINKYGALKYYALQKWYMLQNITQRLFAKC